MRCKGAPEQSPYQFRHRTLEKEMIYAFIFPTKCTTSIPLPTPPQEIISSENASPTHQPTKKFDFSRHFNFPHKFIRKIYIISHHLSIKGMNSKLSRTSQKPFHLIIKTGFLTSFLTAVPQSKRFTIESYSKSEVFQA